MNDRNRSGQMVPVKTLATQVQMELERYSRNVASSLPPGAVELVKPERAVRLIMNECRRIPKLLDCSPSSLVGALLTSAALGLEIGSHLGHAYILPFKGVATFVVGYKGLIALAYRSGQVSSIGAHIVYERDRFDVELGSVRRISHVPFLDGDPGKTKYYYAIADIRDGGSVFNRPMTTADATRARQRSPSASRGASSPWDTDFDQMALKTAVRRLAKLLPASTDLAMAVAQDEALEDRGVRPAPLPSLDWLPESATGVEGETLSEEVPAQALPVGTPNPLSGDENGEVTFDPPLTGEAEKVVAKR